MENPMDLSGKLILVAGACTDIGRAIVNKLKLLGADMVLFESQDESSDCFKAEYFHLYKLDLSSSTEIESYITTAVGEKGIFSGMVYCAGSGGVRPLSLLRYTDMENLMKANFFTFIELVRCISRKKNFIDGGSIVALSSVSSIKGLKSKTAYSASKAALDASVKCLAAELSERRIRINTIRKGWVVSDLESDYVSNNLTLTGNQDLKNQCLGLIQPEEIANVAAFLLSDATRSITGTSVLIDAGYTL